MEKNKRLLSSSAHKEHEALMSNIPSAPSRTSLTQSDSHKSGYTQNNANGLLQSKMYFRSIRVNNIQLIFQALKIITCFLYFELDFKDNQYAQRYLQVALLLHLLSVALRCLVEKIRFESLEKKEKVQYSLLSTVAILFVTTGVYPQPWLQNIIIPMQYHDHPGNDYPYPYPLNYLLLIAAILLAMLKIIQGLFLNSIHNHPRAKRICKIYQLWHQESYAIKCMFKDRPISIFAGIFCSVWLFFTLALRIAEAPVPIYKNPFLYYENCMWYSGITASTTGFGDVTVRSDIGVYITFLCGLWGNLNMSIMVVLILNTLNLSQNEIKSLSTSNKVSKQLQRKQLSGKYIAMTVRRLWYNKKFYLDFGQSIKEKKLKNKLANMRSQSKLSHPIEELTTHMQRQFDRRLIDLQMLVQNNKSMLSHMGKEIFLKSQSGLNSDRSIESNFRKDKREVLLVESIHDMGSSSRSCGSIPKVELHSPRPASRRATEPQIEQKSIENFS